MGLLDHVKGAYEKVNKKMQAEMAKTQYAMDRAEDWDIEQTCRAFSRESNVMAKRGYFTALKQKCNDASDRELIEIFEHAYQYGDDDVLKPISSCMLSLGLLEKDDNGHLHKNY